MFDYSTIDLDGMLSRAYQQMSPKQRLGVSKGKSSGRIIFDVWMGLGKTFMGLTTGLCFRPQRWVIICSKNALNGWKQEINKWYPELNAQQNYTIVRGTKAEREKAWLSPSLFYATTGASFIRDLEFLVNNNIAFDVISVDEAHKLGLRNRKSKFFQGMKDITHPKYFLSAKKKATREKNLTLLLGQLEKVSLINILTGSLTTKGPAQMWSYLHLCDPKLFSSYWKFMNTFMIVIDGAFGREYVAPKNTEALARATSPYIFRVDKKEAAQELPPLRRVKLPFEMTDKIWSIYNSLEDHGFIALDDGSVDIASTQVHKFIKLRQLLCCPSIIDPQLGHGQAIEMVVDKIQEFDELPYYRHNVIFSPFIPSLEVFKSYLSTELKMPNEDILVMKGGMEPEEVQHVEETFRNNLETMVVCSCKFAQSFNLETAFNAYFPHFEWSQDDNEQAEGRLRRKTSDLNRPITAYYATCPGTMSDLVFNVLDSNERINNLTYQDFQRIRNELHQLRQRAKS